MYRERGILLSYNITVVSPRWTCIGWPHKIQLQMEATEASLESDEERFQKNLLADQNTFQDRLDSLNMAVAGFAAHTDLSKSHEVANEVRRLTKQLKECQTLATTYNNRERLFGLPVTSVRCFNACFNKDTAVFSHLPARFVLQLHHMLPDIQV